MLDFLRQFVNIVPRKGGKMASFMQEQSSVLYTKHIKSTSGIYQSSNINEVIRAILNLLIIFFTRRFHTHTKSTKRIQANKNKTDSIFYAHKKHLTGRKLLAWRFVLFYMFFHFFPYARQRVNIISTFAISKFKV